MRFDLLIQGGRVIDPSTNRDGLFDVAISNGKVAALDDHIPAEAAFNVVDATGLLVLPGLIDLHTHVYHKCTYWGIDPDTMAYDSGVTTWVDAGSAGAINLGGLREYIVKNADVRIRAFVNVSYIGLVAPDFELRMTEHLDGEILGRVLADNADFVVGIKVRMSAPTVGPDPLLAMRVARQIADLYELPLMVHIYDAPPEIGEVLALMREGDIVTHCFTAGSMKLVDDDGVPLAELLRARDRGVLLDVGHGAGGFAFSSAEALISSGITPHVISTDLHQMSRHASAVISNNAVASPIIRLRDGPTERLDLPLVMSKFLSLGLSLRDVVAATTALPATIIGAAGEVGTLRAGARADIGLFKLVEGDFVYRDVFGGSRPGSRRLVNAQTFIAGHRLHAPGNADVAPWVERIPSDRAKA